MSDADAIAERYEGLILDLDGCLWVGTSAVPGAPEAVDRWRAADRALVFLTNDPASAPEDVLQRLWSHGVRGAVHEIVTSGVVMQEYLAARFSGGVAVVVGSPAMVRHVQAAGLKVVSR